MKPEDCIFFQIAKTNQAAMKYFSSCLEGHEVTHVQAMVLLFLIDEDGVTAKNLGGRAGLDSATLTGVLDRLAAMDLVERRPNPDDRRAILVFLTDKGRRVSLAIAKEAVKANRALLRTLDASDRDSLRSMLHALRDRAGDL